MSVEILYFAEFKDITRKEKEKLELTNHNLKELIDVLLKKYSGLRKLIWDDKLQKLSDPISVIINNQPFHSADILSKKLNDGDIIAFLLPVSGG